MDSRRQSIQRMAIQKRGEIHPLRHSRRSEKWQYIFKAIGNWNKAGIIIDEWDLKNRVYVYKMQILVSALEDLLSAYERLR